MADENGSVAKNTNGMGAGDITGILNTSGALLAGIAREFGGDEFVNRWTGVTDNRNYQQSLIDQANQYNSPKAIKERLMAAGLTEAQANRFLAGQSAAAGTTAVQSPGAGSDSKGTLGMIGSILELVNSLADTVNKNASTDNTKADTEKRELELPFLENYYDSRNRLQEGEATFKEKSSALLDQKVVTERLVQGLYRDEHEMMFLRATLLQQQWDIGESELKQMDIDRQKSWQSLDKLYWETFNEREKALHARRGFQLQDAETLAKIRQFNSIARYYSLSADDILETQQARIEEMGERANYYAQAAGEAQANALYKNYVRRHLLPTQAEATAVSLAADSAELQILKARESIEGKPFAHFWKTYAQPVVHLASELVIMSYAGALGAGAIRGFKVVKGAKAAKTAAQGAKAAKTARTAAEGAEVAKDASAYVGRRVSSFNPEEARLFDALKKDKGLQDKYFSDYLKAVERNDPDQAKYFSEALNRYFREN